MREGEISIQQHHECTSVHEFLKFELLERQKRNPSFSLRAMARLCGISPSFLSKVMDHQKNLSLKQGEIIAKKLQLSEEYTLFFLCLVELSTAAPQTQKLLQRRLSTIRSRKRTVKLAPSINLKSLRWEHLFLLVYVGATKKTNESELVGVSHELGVNLEEVSKLAKELVRAGLLEKKSGYFKRTEVQLLIESQNKSQTLQSIHTHYLDRLKRQIKKNTLSERFSTTEFYSIPKKNMEELKKRTEDYLDDISSLCGTDKDDQILEISLHLNLAPITTD